MVFASSMSRAHGSESHAPANRFESAARLVSGHEFWSAADDLPDVAKAVEAATRSGYRPPNIPVSMTAISNRMTNVSK
jgi:hypothetical protein